MKKIWNSLKNAKPLKEVFFPEYKFDKWVFRMALVLVFVVVLQAAFSVNFSFKQMGYYKCHEDTIGACNNPFYLVKNCPFENPGSCDIKYLMPGSTLGVQPNFWMVQSPLIIL